MRVVDRRLCTAALRGDDGARITVKHVVLQAHVVPKLMGEAVIAGRTIALDDVERQTRKSDFFASHQVGLAAASGVIAPQADNIGAVQIAKLMHLIHIPVSGALQARQIRQQVGFLIVHFARINQPDALCNAAVCVGGVGVGKAQIDQRFHGVGAALGKPCGGRVHHHDVNGGAIVDGGVDGGFARPVPLARRCR